MRKSGIHVSRFLPCQWCSRTINFFLSYSRTELQLACILRILCSRTRLDPTPAFAGHQCVSIDKYVRFLTDGIHLQLPLRGPKVPCWTCGGISVDKNSFVHYYYKKHYSFRRVQKEGDMLTAKAATEQFSAEIFACGMNTNKAREATERYASLGAVFFRK